MIETLDQASEDLLLEALEAARDDPALFADLFLMDPNGNGPVELNYAQRRILEEHELINWICVHRRAGKCMAYDTLVINGETLRPIEIGCASGIRTTLCYDFSQNCVVETTAQWIDSGQKTGLRLFLWNGFDLTLTNNHCLFERTRGWIPAIELKPGDEILAPGEIRIFGDISPTTEETARAVDLTLTMTRIPDEVFRYDRHGLGRYLLDLFGSVGRILKMRSSYIFNVQDRFFSRDLHHLLLRFGIASNIDSDYRLSIDTETDQRQFLRALGYDVTVLEVHSPRRWERIREIHSAGRMPVFDIGVQHPDHNFIANDCVAHNSYVMAMLAIWGAFRSDNQTVLVYAPTAPQIEVIFRNIDNFIEASPLVKNRLSRFGNQKSNRQIRTFKPIQPGRPPSIIEGRVLGLTSKLSGGLRGGTADVVLIDEAQEVRDDGWAALMPIMIGDKSGGRFGKVLTFITGTVKEAAGLFFTSVYKSHQATSLKSSVVLIPITENRDWSEEEIEVLRATVLKSDGEYIWDTEYLLQVKETESSVFRKIDIDAASTRDWAYGAQNVEASCFRMVAVDWDKAQAGTNIAVIQYDPMTKRMRPIWHEEVPRGEFTYTIALERVLELYYEYSCHSVVIDSNAAGLHFENLKMEAIRRGDSELLANLTGVTFQSYIEVRDPETAEITKKRLKPFLVKYLRDKVQKGEIELPNGSRDDALGSKLKMYNQFIQFREIDRTADNIRYNDDNEHIVDLFLFATYVVYHRFENQFEEFNPEFRSFQTFDTKPKDEEVRDLHSELIQMSIGQRQLMSRPYVFRAPLGGRELVRRSF